MNSYNLRQKNINNPPKEWKIKRIIDIGDVITGSTPSTKLKDYWGEGFPFITPSDFSNHKYVYNTERSVTQKAISISRLIPKESVLVTCIASIGEIAMSHKDCITNQQINTIVCKGDVNPHYIYYSVKFRKRLLQRWAGITTSPIIKKSLFEKFKLEIPPLPEQKKIAEILSTVDQAIEKIDEAIEKTERLKKGFMQQLFMESIHKKDTHFLKLKEVVKINKETIDPTKDFPNTKFIYIDIDSIEKETGIFRNKKVILGKDAPLRARRVIHNNDVIMSTVRPYLKAFTIVPKEYDKQICSTGFAVLTPTNKIIPLYLLYTLFTPIVLNQCNKMMMGGQYPALNSNQVSDIKIPLLSLVEQQKAADILSTMDINHILLKKKKDKLERVKKGLMNDLLTGRKRVKLEA